MPDQIIRVPAPLRVIRAPPGSAAVIQAPAFTARLIRSPAQVDPASLIRVGLSNPSPFRIIRAGIPGPPGARGPVGERGERGERGEVVYPQWQDIPGQPIPRSESFTCTSFGAQTVTLEHEPLSVRAVLALYINGLRQRDVSNLVIHGTVVTFDGSWQLQPGDEVTIDYSYPGD